MAAIGFVGVVVFAFSGQGTPPKTKDLVAKADTGATEPANTTAGTANKPAAVDKKDLIAKADTGATEPANTTAGTANKPAAVDKDDPAPPPLIADAQEKAEPQEKQASKPANPASRDDQPRQPAKPVEGEGQALTPVVLQTMPQNLKNQEQRYRDMYAWNRRTLVGAYDKVGKKDPRWDKPAREALEQAARLFSRQLAPATSFPDIYPLAKEAIAAGCDDPLVLYVYARSSYTPNYPGPAELERRYSTAAAAMERSAYPPFRMLIALCKAAHEKLEGANPSDQVRKEAERLFDAALALLPISREQDERNLDMENLWLEECHEIMSGYKVVIGGAREAFDRVDAVLARTPSLRVIRLKFRAGFMTHWAWEARGSGYANTVTPEGWQKFSERLKDARQALEDAWALQPNDSETATLMLTVELGLGGKFQDMEKWFVRAMQGDPTQHLRACETKMQWLEPKWHGSREELLAFGKACRDTKNWYLGITLMIARVHYKIAFMVPQEERSEYLHSPEVWNDIKTVYDEYLQHLPHDNVERSRYAAYCYVCGDFVEAHKQFQILGDESLCSFGGFSEEWMKKTRAYVAYVVKRKAKK